MAGIVLLQRAEMLATEPLEGLWVLHAGDDAVDPELLKRNRPVSAQELMADPRGLLRLAVRADNIAGARGPRAQANRGAGLHHSPEPLSQVFEGCAGRVERTVRFGWEQRREQIPTLADQRAGPSFDHFASGQVDK